MFGFFFSIYCHADCEATADFHDQKSVEIDRLKFVYSSTNCDHNEQDFQQDGVPFVFIYGEMNSFNAAIGDSGLSARWLSQQIKAKGLSFIHDVDGLFAVIVYDAVTKKVTICTDNVGGFCTLYYHSNNDGLLCSSSFNLIANCLSCLKIDPDSISQLVATGYVLPQRTLARDIGKLGPGCIASVSNGRIAETSFSGLPFLKRTESLEHSTGEEFIFGYLQRYANKDACFLLSGGLDSSTLVGMAAKELGKKITCYTGMFSGFGHLDESEYAKIVANHCNVDLRCIELGHENVLQNLPKIVESIGEPFLDYSILPTYALFKEISKDYRAVFSGDGPDHLFNRYYPLAAKRTLGYIANHINFLPSTNKYVKRLKRSSSEDIEYAYSDLFALPHWGHNSRDDILSLLNQDFRREFPSVYVKSLLPGRMGKSHADNQRLINFIDFYIDGSFGVFSKVGKAASALGLLIREPYLATPYAKFVASLPMEEKIHGGFYAQVMSKCVTKTHLREKISRKYLPESIITRKKGGFTPPLESWLQDFLLQVRADERFSETAKSCLDMSKVNVIFQEFLDNQKFGCLVFMLISFDLWTKIFIEKQNLSNLSLSDVY